MPPIDEFPTPSQPDAVGPPLTESALQRLESFRTSHKTQVLTILFTDLVGSMALQDKLGNVRASDVVRQHNAIVRAVLQPMDGLEVETAGDSFLVVFAVPSEAVKFALYMQARMRKTRQTMGDLPGVRVGIHQGQVVVEQHETGAKAMDIYGLQVSTTARIMSLADGGQILCSRVIFDDARAILRGDDFAGLGTVAWRNHGPYKFKGVEDTYDVCEAGEEGFAPLTAPAAGEKAWPAGRGSEEMGWRPAAGVTVPGTKWVLQDRLGKEDDGGAAPKFRGEFGEVWKAYNGDLKSNEVFKFCFKRDRVPVLKREARLLKRLQKHRHPNLLEVYGVTEGDRPPYYLEMEYVEGPSMEEYLADNPPLKDRLEIVAQVADALDTVHAAGIYHRDIKPSNILLTYRQDGAIQAKLTDFGLGAAEDKELLQSIEVSRVQSVAGTWDYIAPEMRTGGKANAQSDIYSLGLTLFQIVTGDLKTLAGPGWEAQVDDEIVRGDIARCMDADPAKRWCRAAELATALRSHDERLERLRLQRQQELQKKRARRLKATVAIVGAFAVVTLGLGAYAWYQRGEAQHQRDVAEDRRVEAQNQADKANAVTRFLQNMLASVDPSSAQGHDVSVRTVLDKAQGTVAKELAAKPLVEAAIHSTIGVTYHALGLYDKAEPHLLKALEIRKRILGEDNRDTLESMQNVANLWRFQGKFQDAEKLHSQTLLARQRLFGNDDLDTIRSMCDLAGIFRDEGRYAESETLYRQTLAARLRILGPDHLDTLSVEYRLAVIVRKEGKFAEAETIGRKVLEARLRLLGPDHPDTLMSKNNLAIAIRKQGRYAEAEQMSRETLAARLRVLGQDHSDTLFTMNCLADALSDQHKYAEAEDLLRKALSIQLRVMAADHEENLLTTDDLANVLCQQGKYQEAEKLSRQALADMKRVLGENHPDTLNCMGDLAIILRMQNKYPESETLFSQALPALRRVLGENHPETLYCAYNYALLLDAEGKFQDAENLFRLAFLGRQQVLGKDHPDTQKSLDSLIRFLEAHGKAEEANQLRHGLKTPPKIPAESACSPCAFYCILCNV